MKFTEFTEGNKESLDEAVPAFNLRGLDPVQFQNQYKVSPSQAARTVNNIVNLNPQFKTPQFKNAITNYLLDNPKALQAANNNFKAGNIPSIPKSTGSKAGSLAKGVLGRLFGAIGFALTPSTAADGTISDDQSAAWNEAEKFLDHLSTNDPQAFVDLIDAEANAMSADDIASGDPRTHPRYVAAKDALTKAAASLPAPELGEPATSDPAPDRTTPKTDPKPANKPGPPIRVVPEPETTPKPDTKPADRPTPTPKPDTKPPAKPAEPKPDSRPDTKPKPDSRPDTKPSDKPAEPKPDTKPTPDTTPSKPKTTPKTIKAPEIVPVPGPRPLPQPRLKPKGGKGNGKKRTRRRFGLPGFGLPGIGPVDATAMKFSPIKLTSPLKLDR